MNRPAKITLLTASLILTVACFTAQTTPTAETDDQVETSVASTLTALNSAPVSTATPPAPTETPTPTATFIFLTVVPTNIPPTAKPQYSCDIIDQRPYDDTTFHRGESFDIKWTIINNGTVKWEHETFLVYQNGPKMTDTGKVELPRLKPGETYEAILDAKAPDDLEMQVMVWAVVGPGTAKNSEYWMCYPYTRIIVKN